MLVRLGNEASDIPLPYALTIIALLSLCFVNSYDGEFVFDDTEAIVNNDDVQDSPMLDIFRNDFWGTKLSHNQSHKSYRPLTILTFRMHFWLRGQLIPQDYHLVNIILHCIVSMTMLFLFNILLGSKKWNTAFYSAILFTVHPVHVEAVSGIVGRAELLSALFVCLSILLYSWCIFAKKLLSQWTYLCGCIVCIAIAMFSKETGISAVGICIMYDLFIVNEMFPINILHFTSYYSKKNVVKLVKLKYMNLLRLFILVSTAAVLLLVRFTIMGFTVPIFQPVDNPASFVDSLLFRVLNYNYIYCLNIWLMLCPEWLCFDWSMGCIPLITGYDKRIFIIFIFWLLLGAFFLYIFLAHKDKHVRDVTMGLILLIIPFIPASNIFFNVGFVLAERTLYMPSAGYCLLLGIGFKKLCNHLSVSKALYTFYILLILIFFARSWKRSNQWKTEQSLFRSALHVCPLNAKVHYNIAKNAADAGNTTLAKLEYEEALRLNPRYAQAMNNLGNLLKDQKEYAEAEGLFKEAVKLQKNFATAWMNLGIVLSILKKFDESEKSYLTALAYRPRYPDCYYNLGVLYLEDKKYSSALTAWKNATEQKVTHKRAWTNLVLLLDDLGMPEEALNTAKKALEFIPDHAALYFNIANILGKAGKFLEAEEYFKNAILRNPRDPIFYTNLGVLYHRWNKVDNAQQMYKKALEINPNFISARDNLKRLRISKT